MNKPIAWSLLVGGMLLLICGVNAINPATSDFAQLLPGTPSDNAIWMLPGGTIATAIGLTYALRLSRRKRN